MASADKLGQALGNIGKLQEDQERIKRLKRSQQQDEMEGEEATNMVYTDSSTFLKVSDSFFMFYADGLQCCSGFHAFQMFFPVVFIIKQYL